MDSKTKWNNKYIERLNQSLESGPNERLKNLVPYLTGGHALDLACGLGGNSLFLGQLNYQIEALDVSDIAIEYVTKQVEEQGVAVNPKVADLTNWYQLNYKENSMDLVVITYYLDRMLMMNVKSVIKDKGYVFIETFYRSPQQDKEGISDKYKLESGELLSIFKDWQLLYYEENEMEGRQTIFVRKQ